MLHIHQELPNTWSTKNTLPSNTYPLEKETPHTEARSREHVNTRHIHYIEINDREDLYEPDDPISS